MGSSPATDTYAPARSPSSNCCRTRRHSRHLHLCFNQRTWKRLVYYCSSLQNTDSWSRWAKKRSIGACYCPTYLPLCPPYCSAAPYWRTFQAFLFRAQSRWVGCWVAGGGFLAASAQNPLDSPPPVLSNFAELGPYFTQLKNRQLNFNRQWARFHFKYI